MARAAGVRYQRQKIVSYYAVQRHVTRTIGAEGLMGCTCNYVITFTVTCCF
jgi:hypothetical protein